MRNGLESNELEGKGLPPVVSLFGSVGLGFFPGTMWVEGATTRFLLYATESSASNGAARCSVLCHPLTR